jgi:hypothetical protein
MATAVGALSIDLAIKLNSVHGFRLSSVKAAR